MAEQIEVPGVRADVPIRALAGLGLLSVVNAQAYPGVEGFWRRRRLVLRGSFYARDLEHFLLFTYLPGPIFSPWNGGGGLFGPDGRAGLDAIEGGRAPRLVRIGQAALEARRIAVELGIRERPGPKKEALLDRLDAAWVGRDWLRACFRRAPGGWTARPLLGTGGNHGRTDLAAGYTRRLLELLDPSRGRWSAASLRAALWDEVHPDVMDRHPAGATWPAALLEPRRVAPWLYVLALEGAVFVHRCQLDAGPAPPVPASGNPNEAARPALSIPLWSSPSTVRDLERGRAGHAPIAHFAAVERRYPLLVASGAGQHRPRRSELEPLRAWRAKLGPCASSPEPLRRALWALDAALLTGADEPREARRLLVALSDAERLHALHPRSALAGGIVPLPKIPSSWVERADQGEPDMRVARHLGALIARAGPPLRAHVVSLDPNPRTLDPSTVTGPLRFLPILSRRLRALGRRGLVARRRPPMSEALAADPTTVARLLPAVLAAEPTDPPEPAPPRPASAWLFALHEAAERPSVASALAAGSLARALKAAGIPAEPAPGPESTALALLAAGEPG